MQPGHSLTFIQQMIIKHLLHPRLFAGSWGSHRQQSRHGSSLMEISLVNFKKIDYLVADLGWGCGELLTKVLL